MVGKMLNMVTVGIILESDNPEEEYDFDEFNLEFGYDWLNHLVDHWRTKSDWVRKQPSG